MKTIDLLYYIYNTCEPHRNKMREIYETENYMKYNHSTNILELKPISILEIEIGRHVQGGLQNFHIINTCLEDELKGF